MTVIIVIYIEIILKAYLIVIYKVVELKRSTFSKRFMIDVTRLASFLPHLSLKVNVDGARLVPREAEVERGF